MASRKVLLKRHSSAVDEYIQRMRQTSTISSAGDVMTLRSQLHSRRMELTEQILKEDRIVDGSQKLFDVTTDAHVKDQVALEKSFSESKIKTFQAELSKINSSLTAYQAEGCETTQIPLIPLAFKVTHKINFEPAFKKIAATHYHIESSSLAVPIQTFQELRDTMSCALPRSETGLKLLYEYHSHLKIVSKRFIHHNLRHELSFTWYDAINGLPSQQQTVVFEQACVLFNVGALYSQLAARVDRGSPEGKTEAVQLLAKAAGIFEYIRSKFSNAPSRDLSPEVLCILADLMRAQAQELLFEDSLIGGTTFNALIDHAHKAQCIADCYTPVRENMEMSEVKCYLPECWVALVKVKEMHYKAMAHYYAALVHGMVTKTLDEGQSISEDICTELHFLYIESPNELNSSDSAVHIGLMQGHLDAATLSHEFAIKFHGLCRNLHQVMPITKMLSEAADRTNTKREEVALLKSVTLVFPSIQGASVSVVTDLPKPSSIKVKDLFHCLGPLPAFSGDNFWSPSRQIMLSQQESLGLSIRKSHPVVISRVEKGSAADAAGVCAGDWILSVNGKSVLYQSHQQVVDLIRSNQNNLVLQLTTPR